MKTIKCIHIINIQRHNKNKHQVGASVESMQSLAVQQVGLRCIRTKTF